MKKLITTVVLLVFAFNLVDAQIEKNSKIKNSKDNGFQKIKVKQKIDKNAILESDLFVFYNKSELLKLDKKKKNLRKRMTQGDKNAEVQLKKLSAKRKMVQIDLNEAVTSSANVRRFNPVYIDFPPLPCPPEKECAIGALKELVVNNHIKSIQIIVYDKNGSKLGYLEKEPFFIEKKNGIKRYKFNMSKKYSGPITLKVKRINKGGIAENYQISLNLK